MPVPYDFREASRNTPRRNGSGWKRLRFFGLLLIVAAITVGGIMILVPKNDVTQEKKDGTNGQGSGGTPASDSDKDSENSGNSANDNGSSSGSSGEGSSSGNDDAGDSGKNIDQEKNISADGKEKDKEKEDVPPGGKGKELPGDLAEGEDRPVYRPGQAPGGAEALEKAASLSDPDEIMACLRAFLMKEYSAGGEYSANWSAVGKELAAVLRKKAEKNDWKAQSIVHKAVPRDNLIRIARRYHTTVEGIKLFNKRKNDIVRIGDRFSVVTGPWKITLSKKARLLNLWRKEKDSWQIFAVFPIGVGRKNLTPNGKFVINIRLRHPRWHGPDGRIFAYGDKDNPLGDYFLKLRSVSPRGVKKDQGYGIHGSADDSSMGRSLSNGCIRMKNSDVEILYYLLPAMTPVEITD